MTVEREERRIVTMLFADLVGSTSLAEGLDPEEVKLVIGDAIARVIRVIESYGGHVKDIAGDGLLAFFGAPVAHEDDPERAARAGLEVVLAVAAYSGEITKAWGVGNLAVRVGIHTGEVVVGLLGGGGRVEYGAVGDPVNVAARLQSVADPGTVILSEATGRLLAGRFELGPALKLQLKGRGKPVIAHAVVGLASPESLHGGQDAALSPLVGRAAETNQLEAVAKALRQGQGGILVVSGEPGIGKSRMVAELRRLLAAPETTWLEGRCVSYGESLPYWPYRDLLRNWLQLGSQDPAIRVGITLRRRLQAMYPESWAEVFPYLAGVLGLSLEGEEATRVAQLPPESIQYRTFEVLTGLVADLTAAAPLVISIDDLHWADPTSLQLTERLMARAESHPLLLVLTSRPETEHPSWQLRERAAREYRHIYRELSLGPLDSESESILVESLAGGRSLSAETRERILEYSAGNAFYLEEIVRSVREGESSGTASNRGLAVPATIEGVLLARIDRLEPAWRNLLTAASILGRSFTVDLLAAVSGETRESVRSALHHLMRLDLVQHDRGGQEAGYRLKHALISETAYRTLLAAQRSVFHTRAAKWLESFHAGRPERVYGLIAHHWRAANDTAEAVRYLRLAGDQALREWSLDEAIGHYRALLPLLEQQTREGEAAELLFQLASTLHLALRYAEANEVWQEGFVRWQYPDPPANEATATLRIATNQIPWSTVDGHFATNQALIQQLWDRLLEARPAPYLVPGLAEWWDVSGDGLTYRIRIREGVSWNDGVPISAADIIHAFRTAVDPARPSLNSSILFVIENAEARSRGEVPAESLGVRALDDRTVEIRLTRRTPHFLFYCAYPEFSAMRSDRAGSGPFTLKSMDEAIVVLERDARYGRRRGGNVARIEFILATDPERLRRDLLADEIDAVWARVRVDETLPEAGLSRLPTPRTSTGFIAFAGSGPHASDLPLRRALALATDREPFGVLMPPHQLVATGGLVPPGIAGHSPDIVPRFDPEAARRWLSKSSHRGPLVLGVAVEQRQPHLEALAEMWRRHLDLEVSVFSAPVARSTEWMLNCDAAAWNWVAHAPDPEYFLRNLLHGQSRSRLAGWKLPALDALLDRALETPDGALRLDLYHQADRLAVQEECVVIPLVYFGLSWLVKPWVHGIWQWGAPWQSWDEVSIDESSPRHRPR